MSDRIVLWGILIVVVGAWVAGALGVFGPGFMALIVPVAVTLIAAFVGGWQLDRNRHIQVDRHFDSNKPNFYVPMTNQTWQIPTAYIDHKSGTGPPPGVEQYDQGEVDEAMDERRGPFPSEDSAP